MIGPTISRLTGPGVSAVAVYALEGPGAFGIISSLFRRKGDKPLPDPWPPGRALFGTFGGPPGDEVIVLARAPQSYEIHAHGGERLGRWLVGLCVGRGAVEGPASSISGFADQQCAALLCRAPTERTARILLGLANGVWHEARTKFFAELAAGNLDAAEAILERWESLLPVARHLVEPFVVAIVGAPNAGKSSLLNRLVGFERAVVSPEAGTTRDLVTADTAIEGWPVRLIDTAGLREGGEELESEGMALARQQAAAADLVIWLHDRSAARATTGQDFPLLTKADLPPHRDWIGSNLLAVSAVTGEGIDGLLGLIAARLVPNAPELGEGFPPTDDEFVQMQAAIEEAYRGA